MITLQSTRIIEAPRWLCFEMIRHVDVHAAAVPEIRARAEAGRQHGPLHLGEWTTWSAVYFGWRFRIVMEVTGFDWPIGYTETNCGGIFQTFEHRYQFVALQENRTMVSDCLGFESGYGRLGEAIDRMVLAPRLQAALEQRMDAVKRWSEDGTWKQWIPEQEGTCFFAPAN